MCHSDGAISKFLANLRQRILRAIGIIHLLVLIGKSQKHGGYYGKQGKKQLPEPRTYTVEQIAAILNIGRATAYHLVKQENFKIVRIGNAIRISKKSFDEWLENMEL